MQKKAETQNQIDEFRSMAADLKSKYQQKIRQLLYMRPLTAFRLR
jgi:hypothetical protein